MDGPAYALTELCRGSDTTLFRAHAHDDAHPQSVLLRVANSPHQDVAGRLAWEYGLAERLGSGCALKANALTDYEGRRALVLADPGGCSLQTLIDGPLELSRYLEIAVGIAAALRQVHGQGIVHLDLCPANIFVEKNGHVLLTGFGRASLMRERGRDANASDVVPSMYEFMSPEQSGRTYRVPDQRSDLYSVGVVLYRMLTGSVPFEASNAVEWFHCHIARQAAPPESKRPDAPPIFSSMILKLLTKSPEERYQTAAGLEHDLRRCMDSWGGREIADAFPLGEYDTVDTLVAPRRIYGRDGELRALSAGFERAAESGNSELFLIVGYSGVGKSSVVEAFLKSVSSHQATIAAGKFDQYRPDVPYSTITQAFAALVDNLLSKDDEELASWREAIMDALGPNGQLMVGLIPQLELIIGSQPKVPDAPPWEHQARFRRVLHRFINVFARRGRPLILFLDDLQWLDLATLTLLETLVSDDEMQNFMVIGAYRDNEVGERHPLMATIDRLRAAGRPLRELPLSPLGMSELSAMVADTMTVTIRQVEQLSELVFEKTEGNPFFAVQFLSILVEQGLLRFDQSKTRWSWELAEIRAQSITENVATILASKLERLPLSTQEALGVLACLGSEASFPLLVVVLGATDVACEAMLAQAVEAGVITTKGEKYLFLHDRLQEAAYAMVSPDKRELTHLRIGQSMLLSYSSDELAELIFDVAGHFNRCSNLITSSEERETVVRLNLLAAQRAKMSTAYGTALTFVEAGLALLGPSKWDVYYALTFDLSILQADCSLLAGDLHEAERLAQAMRINCRTKIHQAMRCCMESDLHVIRSDYVAAIEVALESLTLFGIDLSTNPTEEDVACAFANFWRLLDGREIASLVDLPRSSDPDVEAAMRVLQALFTPAGLYNSNLFYMVVSYMVELTLRHGTTSPSPIGLAWFAVVFGHVSGRHSDALEIGFLANAIVERDELVAERAKARFCLEMLLAWTRPISEAIEVVREAYAFAIVTGDVITACFSAAHLITDRLLRGERLDVVLPDVQSALVFARSAKYRDVVDCFVVQDRFIRSMRGETDAFGRFDGAGFDTTVFEAELTDDRMAMMIFFYWTAKGAALYLDGNFVEAAQAMEEANALLPRSHGHIQRLDLVLFSALTDAALATSDPSADDYKMRRGRIVTQVGQLRRWAENCHETFADRAALVSAELARIDGDDLVAMKLYDDAIALSKRYGSLQNEAIGNEIASRYYRSRGSDMIADAYLAKARACYSAWGAEGKVRQLERLHPSGSQSSLGLEPGGLNFGSFERLDRSTIIRVSQAISSEIDLSKLIETLMRIALQDSGGERAVLILAQDGGLRVEAEGLVVDAAVTIQYPETPIIPSTLPESILRYVMRAGSSVLIPDAQVDNSYADDPYFKEVLSRSVLCVPIIKYQRAIGALYIENTRLSRVFTPERLEVLSLVSLQAGISLENARLFRDVGHMTGVSRRAESELKHSVDLIPVMVWSVFPSGRGVTFNRQWHDYTGITPESAQDGGWIYSFHPEDRDRVIAKWNEVVEQETPGEIEARILRSDGTSRYFLVRAAPLREEDGTVLKWYGTNTDIDDLKRSEQLVSEERRILEMVGAGADLQSVLEVLCASVERFIERSAGLVLLLSPDGKRLSHCSAPRLMEAFAKTVLSSKDADPRGSWELWAAQSHLVESLDLEKDLPSGDGPEGFDTRWSTPIMSFDRKVLGRFTVFLPPGRTLLPHELKIAEQIVRLTGIIVERKDAEDALKGMNESLHVSLGEKDALLKEVHHRVKNNLQLISSLLSLQADRLDNSDVSVLFAESRDRVRSMALVHENLYRAGNFAKISMQSHTQNLCANLIEAYGPHARNIELDTEVDEIELDLDRAISTGLIINELVSNALKHAFPGGRVGKVVVKLESSSDSLCILSVRDDGIGLPGNFDGDAAETLGLQLVQDLTEQLHGNMTIGRDGGTNFKISFPVAF